MASRSFFVSNAARDALHIASTTLPMAQQTDWGNAAGGRKVWITAQMSSTAVRTSNFLRKHYCQIFCISSQQQAETTN